jgi:hypothetical protein
MQGWPDREFNIEGNPFHNLMDCVDQLVARKLLKADLLVLAEEQRAPDQSGRVVDSRKPAPPVRLRASNTVTLHRPIIDSTQASATALPVGINVTWSVICTDFPQWTIFSRDQVSWSGPFVFYESLV